MTGEKKRHLLNFPATAEERSAAAENVQGSPQVFDSMNAFIRSTTRERTVLKSSGEAFRPAFAAFLERRRRADRERFILRVHL